MTKGVRLLFGPLAGKGLDDDERSALNIVDPHGRQQETTVINESGLYSLHRSREERSTARLHRRNPQPEIGWRGDRAMREITTRSTKPAVTVSRSRQPWIHICAYCGIAFYPAWPSAKQRRAHYVQGCCSASCRSLLVRLRDARIAFLRVLNSRTLCAHCGKSFVGRGRWCSSRCWYHANKPPVQVKVCNRCGAGFLAANGRRIFCSQLCCRRAHRHAARRSDVGGPRG
jgi:hypothetical protein